MKKVLVLLIAGVLAVSATANAQDAEERKFDSRTREKARRASHAMARVIVRFTKMPTMAEVEELYRLGGRVRTVFKYFPGASIEIPEVHLRRLARTGYAMSVSADAAMSATHSDARESSGASNAQTSGSGGSGVGVAVVDSGIGRVADLRNVAYSVDFTMQVAGGKEYDDPKNLGTIDPYGHGTHVAGIIGGSGSSSKGQYAGIAPKAHVIDLRVLDMNGIGYTEDVMEAIEWVITNRNKRDSDGKSLNIRVINLSLGHRPYESPDSDPLAAICRIAVRHGLVVVAAAGNYGRAADGSTVYGGITSPGVEPSVITAGAMTTWGTPSRADDRVAAYSSRGPTIWGTIKPDLVAPGSVVVAARSPSNNLSKSNPSINVNWNYMTLSGTSMSAAVTSGAAALVIEKNPRLTPNAVKATLMYTAEKRSESALEAGAGYLNIPGALELASNIDARTAVGNYWLKNNGRELTYNNLIGNYPVVWSQTIVWETALSVGPLMAYNQPAWRTGVVWGSDDTAWANTIVWESELSALARDVRGETIVWEVAEALNIRWSGQTIVWEILEALTIVWDVLL